MSVLIDSIVEKDWAQVDRDGTWYVAKPLNYQGTDILDAADSGGYNFGVTHIESPG